MHIAVLGAGIQGTCVALELAGRGQRVNLFDRTDACVTQTSAQSEGKVHLGFVYGNDPSLRTARMMIDGALAFAPLMRRWLGGAFDRIPQSSAFRYVIHANSLLTVDAMRHHFLECRDIASDVGTRPGSDYFRRDVRQPARQLPPADWEATLDARNVRAVFETPEIAIDSEALAALLRARVGSVPEINLRLKTMVRGVILSDTRPTVVFEAAGLQGDEDYDHVINALWDGRLAIDASAGLVPQQPWLWRLRRNLRVEAPGRGDGIPSATIVLGPFGDIVNFENGTFFLSWYPTGRVGQSRELVPSTWDPPPDWSPPSSTEEGIFAGLRAIVPGIDDIAVEQAGTVMVREGIVFAWGTSDISDRCSGLHSCGRYHSINTGKFTMAPLFASEAVGRVLGTT